MAVANVAVEGTPALVMIQFPFQLDWQLLLVILPFIMVILVIVFGEILFRRRRRLLTETEAVTPDVQAPPVDIREKGPQESLLEGLQRRLEETSSFFSSGLISKEEFSERVRNIENELAALKVQTPPAEEPKARLCIHCQQEIPVDAVYCDRCGRYLGAPKSEGM